MNLKEVLSQVAQFIRKLKADTGEVVDPIKDTPRVWFSRADFGGVMLRREMADEYGACLRNLFETVAPNEQISRKAVEEQFQSTILGALHNAEKFPEIPFDQSLSDAIEALRQTLQAKPALWQLHFRVAGLAADGLPRTIGRVEFYVADETRIAALSNRFNAVVEGSTNTPEQKQSFKEDTAQSLAKYLTGQVVADIEVEAIDNIAAHSLALRELRLTLDVLNFYADILHPRGMRAYAYLPGERERVLDLSIDYREGDKPTGHLIETVQGPLGLLPLGAMDAEKSKAYGFVRITDILANNHRNKLEERILSAFQWAGRATVDERREEAFLLYAIALESLLLGAKNDVELSYRLRLKCAHLLGTTVESKRRVTQRISALYSMRSKIVHAGSTLITDSELHEIWFYTKNALVALLTEPQFVAMTTETELEQWFDEKLLGA